MFFQSFIQTYLERDVRKLAQVADLTVFHGFLKAAAVRSGQMLNYSDLARDTGISVPTVKKYMSILETSNIAALLHPYKNNRSAETVSTPKMYFMDTGNCKIEQRYSRHYMATPCKMATIHYICFTD